MLIMPVMSFAQSSRNAEKRQKKLEKLKEQRKKEEEKKYEEAVKENYKMQSPATKKMMKQTFKKSIKLSENSSSFFLKRWYDNIFNKRKMKQNQQIQGKNPQQKAQIRIPGFLGIGFRVKKRSQSTLFEKCNITE